MATVVHAMAAKHAGRKFGGSREVRLTTDIDARRHTNRGPAVAGESIGAGIVVPVCRIQAPINPVTG
jgi:hypothetical protein